MERRNKSGRPKAVERRSRHLNIRLTETEYAKLRETAGSIKISDYARRRLLGKTVPRSVPQINRAAWEELARTAANLNQLTHHANQGPFAHSEELAQVLVRLSHTLKTVREGLIGGGHGHR